MVDKTWQFPFEEEELRDLGVTKRDLDFTPDMTFESYRAAEAKYRSALPKRRLAWWDTPETRSRASWVVYKLRSEAHRLACMHFLAWLRFPKANKKKGIADLNYLLTIQQKELADWRNISSEHKQLLDNLEVWFDDPTYDLSCNLLTPVLVDQAMRQAIKHLKQREQDVLIMRFGLAKQPPVTLEEAGKKLSVSRERIRQIEEQALARLSHPSLKLSLAYGCRAIECLLTKTDKLELVPESETSRLVKSRVAPIGKLLLATFTPDEQDTICRSTGTSYNGRFAIGPQADTTSIALAASLEKYATETAMQLPLRFETFAGECLYLKDVPKQKAISALMLTRAFAYHAGYVTSNSPSQTNLDAIDLHARMLIVGGHVDSVFFGRRNREIADHKENGDLTRRDTDAALAHPHMFMKLIDGTWLALDKLLRLESIKKPVRGSGQHNLQFTPDSLFGQIYTKVKCLGIAKLETVRKELNSLPAGSVHAIISGRSEFERIAPGTYAIADTDLSNYDDMLLSKWHISNYLLGRQCGETLTSYRAWSTRIEHKWCKWARSQAPELFPALLYFAAIYAWPIPDIDKDFWLTQQRTHARSPGKPDIYPSGEAKLPDPTELLEMALMIYMGEGTNQLRINRSLGLRPDISSEWSYMAVFSASAWLEDQSSWYSWHRMAKSPEEWESLLLPLLEERIYHGSNAVRSAPFLRLLSDAHKGLQEGRPKWLRKGSREELIRAIETVVSSSDDSFYGDSPNTKSLDELLSEIAANRALGMLKN